MKFKIPVIQWVAQKEQCFDDCSRQTHISQNTFVEYAIQSEKELFYCYYGNGRFKEFFSLDEAKHWVETVHYPRQVQKYFDMV